jgi:hypothetical protein
MLYIDGFEAVYQQHLVATNNQVSFTSSSGGAQATGFSSSTIEVWNVTDPWNPVRLSGPTVAADGAKWSVNFTATAGDRYVASSGPWTPELTAWNANDLKSTEHEIDYLVVHGPGLEDGAAALAADRTAKGLSSKVVSIEDVYNAFNHGIRDGRALKAFLGYAYRQWLKSPRYVVLAGDSSLDYRNYTGAGDSLVPTPPSSGEGGVFVSDHELGDVDGDGDQDMAVGRIPVANAAQLAQYVTKLIAFESGGVWRDQVLVSTDNRDYGGVFIDVGDALAAQMSGKTVNRADIEVLGASGARTAFHADVEDGVEMAIYVGHGSLYTFAMTDNILVTNDVPAFTNDDTPAVVGALSCLTANYSYPSANSVGEELIKNAGGAAAMFGSAGMVTKTESAALFEQIVGQVYEDGEARLGDAWVNAKNGVDALNRSAKTYQLLGDPSIAMGDANAPRGGPDVDPTRTSYAEWLTWAFAPAWLDRGLSTDPNANPDGDHQTNYEEYLAGTDPLDPDSELVVVTVKRLSNGQVELSWPSIPARLYRIERSLNVSSGYVTLADDVPADAPINVWIDTTASDKVAFYRVYVK